MTITANVLYIIAFVLFIYGLSGLTGPSTACLLYTSDAADE